jgi:hypothetical protein
VTLPKAVALAHATPVDDEGCGRGQPGVRVVREGAEPVELPLPAPPSRGVLRRLSRGALAAYLAPVGCRSGRSVLYALRLDEAGAPVGAPVPVGDAASFAVAANGDDVDLWLLDPPDARPGGGADGRSVTWMRATCPSP